MFYLTEQVNGNTEYSTISGGYFETSANESDAFQIPRIQDANALSQLFPGSTVVDLGFAGDEWALTKNGPAQTGYITLVDSVFGLSTNAADAFRVSSRSAAAELQLVVLDATTAVQLA